MYGFSFLLLKLSTSERFLAYVNEESAEKGTCLLFLLCLGGTTWMYRAKRWRMTNARRELESHSSKNSNEIITNFVLEIEILLHDLILGR